MGFIGSIVDPDSSKKGEIPYRAAGFITFSTVRH